MGSPNIMKENSIIIEAANFIREHISGAVIFKIGDDLTGKISATSENFKKKADAQEFYVFAKTGEEKRFIVRRKSQIKVDLPKFVVTPRLYGQVDDYQILELPKDSTFVNYYNLHNLVSSDENQLAFKILDWKKQLIDMNNSVLTSLKENYGENIQLEDFLSASRFESVLIFLG
jgi:hypothetical protein